MPLDAVCTARTASDEEAAVAPVTAKAVVAATAAAVRSVRRSCASSCPTGSPGAVRPPCGEYEEVLRLPVQLDGMSLVITGASGQLGRLVTAELLKTVDPSELILLTRTPDALDVPGARGARVRLPRRVARGVRGRRADAADQRQRDRPRVAGPQGRGRRRGRGGRRLHHLHVDPEPVGQQPDRGRRRAPRDRGAHPRERCRVGVPAQQHLRRDAGRRRCRRRSPPGVT